MERQQIFAGAVKDIVENKMSLRKAAAKWGVKRSTLSDRVTGKVDIGRRNGPPPVLTAAEEKKLIHWIKSMGRRGIGITKSELFKTVKAILDRDKRDTILKNNSPRNLPGNGWYKAFLNRNPSVKLGDVKKPDHKHTKLNQKKVDEWFRNYEMFISDHCLLDKPVQIWNCGAFGFYVQNKTGEVCGPSRTATDPLHQPTTKGKTRITVLACVNAAGGSIPPFYVFPRKKTPRARNQSVREVDGASCCFTETGRVETEAFQSWLADHFIPQIPEARPVVLLLNSNIAHKDFELFKLAEEHSILLYRLLPNGSHFLQPFDDSFYGSLKAAWSSAVREFEVENPSKEITQSNFAKVFKSAWQQSATTENIFAGFVRSGIYPIDRHQITRATLCQSVTLKDSRATRVIVDRSEKEQKAVITVRNAIIKGYDVFQVKPPAGLKLLVKKEYGNPYDDHALLLWLPKLVDIEESKHNIVIDDMREIVLKQVADLPMGNVPFVLSEGIYRCIELNLASEVTCLATGSPRDSFPPWPAEDERGCKSVIPADYSVTVSNQHLSAAVKLVLDAIGKMTENSVLKVEVTWQS
ncbi:uncharacterized protein [Ptychodera flava]|uniref:uncharacterized protein isoform X1 n=1 Tax=Ptychodera flava TaxID=63121 RepID=UPI00396A2207